MKIERLKQVLEYDPETGIWVWLIDRARGKIKKGSLAGTIRKDGYVVIGLDGGHHLSHRLAWFYMTGEWPVIDVDHKDRNPTNNKWSNLREATRPQNNVNSFPHKNNKSGHTGVARLSSGKWRAYIKIDYRYKHLGCYDDKEDAIAAYRKAAEESFGEFAEKQENI